MRQYQPLVSGGAHVFQPDGPSEFMPKELCDRLLRKYHPHRLAHQFHAIAAARDSISQLKIVRVIICHRFPAADLRQLFLGRRHRPPKGELHLPFQPSRHKRPRSGVQVHSKGVQVCRYTARRDAPVKTGNHAHLWICKRWRNNFEVIGTHAHIAVAHHHQVVFRFLHQSAQAIHFAIRANSLCTLD